MNSMFYTSHSLTKITYSLPKVHFHVIALGIINCHSENRTVCFILKHAIWSFLTFNGNAKSGVAFLISTSLNYTIKTDITVSAWDSIWIELFVNRNTRKSNCNITTRAIDRSPSPCTFTAGFDNTLHNILYKNSKIISCGDINIDLTSNNSYTSKFSLNRPSKHLEFLRVQELHWHPHKGNRHHRYHYQPYIYKLYPKNVLSGIISTGLYFYWYIAHNSHGRY